MTSLNSTDFTQQIDDDNSFIDKQVKFMYGKYYDDIVQNIPIKIIMDYKCVLIEDCFININVCGLVDRNNSFINATKKYWEKYWRESKKRYITKTNWHDNLCYNEFIITFNRKYNHKNNVIFPLIDYHFDLKNQIPRDYILFKQKCNVLFWRGSTTGNDNINANTRYNIISKNFNKHKFIDIGFNHLCQNVYNNNKNAFDPLYKKSAQQKNQIIYKFILNIEGNDCASSFPFSLASNCCPLHNYPFSSESYIFGMGLEPYVHFVPIKNDGTDLLERYNWCLHNFIKCEEIANNGIKYMEKYMSDDLWDKVMDNFFKLYPLTQLS